MGEFGCAYLFSLKYFVTNCIASDSRTILEWETLPYWQSTVMWSTNLVTMPFTNLVSGIEYPVNSYTDLVHSAVNECFYRVEVSP